MALNSLRRLCTAKLWLRIVHLHDASASAARIRAIFRVRVSHNLNFCTAGDIDAAPDLARFSGVMFHSPGTSNNTERKSPAQTGKTRKQAAFAFNDEQQALR